MSLRIDEAVILVGGKGTRLSPVVHDRPKPLAIVAGHPFLDYILELLKRNCIKRVVLCSGYMGSHIQEYAQAKALPGFEILVSQENAPLGTGGALVQALPLLGNATSLVLNGDSYCEFHLPSLAQIHEQTRSAASLWLSHVKDASRYGSVDVSCSGKVSKFVEKNAEQKSGWVNAGIYLIERVKLEEFPANTPLSLERDILPSWIPLGLGAIQGRNELVDIGTPESYGYAQAFFSKPGKSLDGNSL